MTFTRKPDGEWRWLYLRDPDAETLPRFLNRVLSPIARLLRRTYFWYVEEDTGRRGFWWGPVR